MDDPQVIVVYEFDVFVLDPARRLLTRAGGEPVTLTGKPFDALLYLMERAGTVVSRQDLAAALWPTTIVEDNNLSQTIAALRRALGDSQETPRFVATVPRRGYQLVAPVKRHVVSNALTGPEPSARVEQTAAGAAAAIQRTPAARDPVFAPTPQRRRMALIALGALAIASAAALAIVAGRGAFEGLAAIPASVANPPSSGNRVALRSSVAVLPFRSLSPDQNDAYFAAGIHEEILSRLAKVRGINVIAATSVLQYADSQIPIGQIAADLNVITIMEGSVRYSPDRVRVRVRLIDAATSAGIWSEDYDVEPSGVFDIQSDIAMRIVAALEPELSPAPLPAQSRPTQSTRAYALYLKTLALYRTHGGIGVSIPLAIRHTMLGYLDEALALDGEFAAALAWRAHLDMDSLMFDMPRADDWRSARAALMQQVDDEAKRAIALDPAQATAHAALARLNLFRFRFDDARVALGQALEINPSDLVVLHYLALTHFLREEHSEAIRVARRALELDPKNPAPHTPLAMALRATGEVDAAAAAYSAMIEAAPTALIGYVALARTRTATGDAASVMEPLRLAEHFLEDARNFRVDAAYSYARVGARGEAERLIGEFRSAVVGRHVDPGLEAMALLALGEHDRAREEIRAALADRNAGMDPLPLALIRQNTWSDPTLERPEWLALRGELGFRR